MLFSSPNVLLALVALATTVSGHARVTSPQTRGTGSNHVSACGAAFVKKLESDKAGPIENSLPYLTSPTTCNPSLCRSYLSSDISSSAVQHLSASNSTLTFHVDVIAGHRPGYANISVISTATNSRLATLKEWANFPCYKVGSTTDGVGECADDKDFNVTIPTNSLGGKCKTAGECVVQWYWYATGVKQTYESCVDFVVV